MLGDPALEEFGTIDGNLRGARNWYDDWEVRQSIANVCHPRISVSINIHLAKVADVLRSWVVCDEGDAAGPPRGSNQSEPATDDWSESIGTYDEISRLLAGSSVFVDCCDSGDATLLILENIGHAKTFFDAGTGRARALEKNRVENGATNSQTGVTVSSEAVTGDKFTVNRCAVWCVDAHSSQLRGAGRFDRVESVHLFENARRLRAQVFGAGLVTREMRTVDDYRLDSSAR
jgi:hypothetical protein